MKSLDQYLSREEELIHFLTQSECPIMSLKWAAELMFVRNMIRVLLGETDLNTLPF